jgi:hypothetical protein
MRIYSSVSIAENHMLFVAFYQPPLPIKLSLSKKFPSQYKVKGIKKLNTMVSIGTVTYGFILLARLESFLEMLILQLRAITNEADRTIISTVLTYTFPVSTVSNLNKPIIKSKSKSPMISIFKIIGAVDAHIFFDSPTRLTIVKTRRIKNNSTRKIASGSIVLG